MKFFQKFFGSTSLRKNSANELIIKEIQGNLILLLIIIILKTTTATNKCLKSIILSINHGYLGGRVTANGLCR